MDKLIEEENKKIRRLRFIVNLTEAIILQGKLSISEARDLVEDTRKSVLRLFPDNGDTFDLIYTPRFNRAITERFSDPSDPLGQRVEG